MKLLPIRKKDYNDISNIVFNPNVMMYIGNGKVWDVEKLTNFIIYNIQEQKLSHTEREHYYYRIVDNDKLKGVIGFYYHHDGWNLKVFINPKYQGKGYFKSALKQILKRLKEYKNVDHLYSQVHGNNLRMNKIMLDKYYYDKSFKMGGKKIYVNQYIIFNRPYTYLVKSDYISDEIVEEIFKLRKNWVKWDSTISKNPDFLHLDGVHYYDKVNQKYNVLVKNIMNNSDNPAVEKTKLFKTLVKKYKHARNYLPLTYFYNSDDKLGLERYKDLFNNSKAFIIKPDGGYAGSGIRVITTFEELKYIQNYKHKRWSFQEYLTNPILIDKRKFHMRVLYIHRDDGQGFMFNQIPIYRAKKPFALNDYKDIDIHISHYSDKDEELYLENLEKELDVISITKQIKNILKDINSIINNKCYAETKNCYEMYGVDFMAIGFEKAEVKLLEFNHKIGLKEFSNAQLPFNKLLLNAELVVGLDYYMPPEEKVILFEDLSFVQI